MRVALVGGTRFVGPVAVRDLLAAGHEVCVAHSGAHEPGGVLDRIEHLHGSRNELLAPGGPVEGWRPEALVDTFAGGATAAKAADLAACARRLGGVRIVAVSSMDVYRHLLDAGIGDGSAVRAVARGPVPIREDAPLREGPYPGARAVDGGGVHDNAAMEAALRGAGDVAVLRPGAIYGPHPDARERALVERVRARERRLALPDGGTQIFHRVAVDRVGLAVAAALERAPAGFWACNVGDPGDLTYGALAAAIAGLLDWEFTYEHVPFDAAEHPWQVRHPVLCSTRRLETVLGVTEPEPAAALEACVRWLWDHPPAGGRGAPDALSPSR